MTESDGAGASASAAPPGHGQAGFTLIEGLVVIALLAILGGIAVLAVSQLTQDADENACVAERRTIETAMWAAYNTGNSTDSYGDYLSDSPKYWANLGTPSAPSWGSGPEHPGGACPATIPFP